MIFAVGRQLFFDHVAGGLLIAFGIVVPKQVAIRANPTSVPSSDLRALASAVCAHLSEGAEVIEATVSQLEKGSITNSPCALDAECNDLSDAVRVLSVCGLYPSVLYNFTDDGAEVASLVYEPSTSADVVYPAVQYLFHQCGKEPDELALARFQLRGFRCFQSDYELFERPQASLLADAESIERLCIRLGSTWRYADAPVSPQHILDWLRQFEGSGFSQEALRLLVYLYQHGYVTEQKIAARLTQGYLRLVEELDSIALPVAFQPPGKSESKLAYKLRPTISLANQEEALAKVHGAPPSVVTNLVCFDDCIGSGETIEKYLFDDTHNPLASEFSALYAAGRARTFVLVYNSCSSGVARIEQNSNAYGAVSVRTICPLDDTHRVFSPTSQIILDADRREAFRDFCELKGRKLFPGGPLGWGDCQWAVAYDYTVPDNSLPIIHSSLGGAHPWVALFPRNR
jgi:hypothetical protein